MQSPTPSLKHEIVRAGAGAGKTTRLTQKVIEVAQDHHRKHGRFPKMILTTFTRKATQEIRERLMKLALEQNQSELFDYVNSTSRLHISTIHGVLSAFLTNYGGRIGLNPRYEIISESKNKQKIKTQLRESLIALPETQVALETYTFQQLCQMANAYYELWSIKRPNPIRYEDFLSVTKKLVTELHEKTKEVLFELAPIELEGGWQDWQERLQAIKKETSDKSFPEVRQYILEELERMGSKPRRSKKNPVSESTDEKLKELLKLYRELKNEIYDPESWSVFIAMADQLTPLFEHFSQSFESLKIIDSEIVMSDLELLSFSLLRQAPEAAQSFASEWDYWFIDEYQDTSPPQVELLGALAGKAPCFVVGDPQQSIYLFRGARSEVFAEQEEQIRSRGGLQSVLMKNYRSEPELLEFFNEYFKNYGHQFSEMEPKEEVTEVSKLVAEVLISDGEADKEDEDLVATSEVRAIVQKIQELLATGVEPSQIAVLARTNRQLEQVADYARSLGIAYQLHSASGFYQRLEIKDAMALLKFVLNPHDNANLIRLLRTPWFLMSDELLVELAHIKSTTSYWLRAQEHFIEHPAIRALVHARNMCFEVGIGESFRQCLIDQMMFEASEIYDSSGRRESNLWKLLAKLKDEEQAEGFSHMEFVQRVEGPNFVAQSDDESDAVPVIEPNKVNLMTVHASKGLQFKHVIIGFMGKSQRKSGAPQFSSSIDEAKWSVSLPNEDSQTFVASLVADHWKETLRERESLEQERLLYVAMTRAKQTITLSWSEPFQKDSFASRCPLNTTEGTHQGTLFSYRVRKESWEGQELKSGSETSRSIRPIYARESIEDKVQLSVTELTAEEEVSSKTGETMISESLGHFEAIERGVRLHLIFELLRYTSPDQWKDLIQQHFAQSPDEALKAIEFLHGLKEPNVSHLIQFGNVEWGFACEVEGAWLQGQIDLWGRDEKDQIWLVDYKTGSSRYSQKAFNQLTLYTLGLKQMGLFAEQGKVNLAVLYPFTGEVKTQELRLDGPELKQWAEKVRAYSF